MKYFGSWVGHSFKNKEIVMKSSESVAVVNRKLDGFSVIQDFRYIKNKDGEHRFIMINCDKEYRGGEYYTWVTNDVFFSKFILGAYKSGELNAEEFEKIKSFLKSKDIEIIEDHTDDKKKEEPDDIEELNFL